jgi:hypothetical protein
MIKNLGEQSTQTMFGFHLVLCVFLIRFEAFTVAACTEVFLRDKTQKYGHSIQNFGCGLVSTFILTLDDGD